MAKKDYSGKIFDIVKECAQDIFGIFIKHGITEINFKDYPCIDYATATFNDDTVKESMYCDVVRLVFTPDDPDNDVEAHVTIFGENSDGETWTAYIDDFGGDYYDVAQSIGRIYNALVQALEPDDDEDDVESIEYTTTFEGEVPADKYEDVMQKLYEIEERAQEEWEMCLGLIES